jgi:hypothetical protein
LKAVDEVTSSYPSGTAAAASSTHQNDGEIEAVAKDDMVFMAEKLFLFQENLQIQGGIDTSVDIGFHYTLPQYYKKITENGLLTASERSQNALGNHSNGAVFGEGIYTANNCCELVTGNVKCLTFSLLHCCVDANAVSTFMCFSVSLILQFWSHRPIGS